MQGEDALGADRGAALYNGAMSLAHALQELLHDGDESPLPGRSALYAQRYYGGNRQELGDAAHSQPLHRQSAGQQGLQGICQRETGLMEAHRIALEDLQNQVVEMAVALDCQVDLNVLI